MCLCNIHSLYWIDCCDLWYAIRFAYIAVVLDRLISQRESKRSIGWVKRMGFKVMDVVSLICGKADQHDGISCFKYVRGAGLQHAFFGIHGWCLYTVIYMGWAVLFKVRPGVCKLLQAGCSLSTPYGLFCQLVCMHKQKLHIQLCKIVCTRKFHIKAKVATVQNKRQNLLLPKNLHVCCICILCAVFCRYKWRTYSLFYCVCVWDFHMICQWKTWLTAFQKWRAVLLI